MTIASEITRLQNDKAAMCAAIEAKGVTVGNVSFDDYAACIDAIPTGWLKEGCVDLLLVGWGGGWYMGWGWGWQVLTSSATFCGALLITVWCAGKGYGQWWVTGWWDTKVCGVTAKGWCGATAIRCGWASWSGCAAWNQSCNYNYCPRPWGWGAWGNGGNRSGDTWGNGWVGLCWYGGGWGWGAGQTDNRKWGCAYDGWGNGGCSCRNACLTAYGCNATNCGWGWGWGSLPRCNLSIKWGNWAGWVVEVCFLADGSCWFSTAVGGSCCYVCGSYCVHRFTEDWIFLIDS